MGGTKSTERTDSNQQTTVQPTAEQTELDRLRLEREKVLDPFITDVGVQGLDLSKRLLSGDDLPGFLGGLPAGISPSVTSQIVQDSLKDVRTGLQSSGLLDSGVRAELEARTAADIRTQSEQFNLQNLGQLLNLAVGGQAQPLAGPLGFGSQLSQSLSGLRGSTTRGNVNTVTRNPFLTGGDIVSGFGTGIGAFGALR